VSAPDTTAAVREPTVWYPDTWPLPRRIAVALAVVGALLIGCVAASAVMLVETREAQHLVDEDYYTALRSSQTYFLGLVDSETAVRGFALSNEPSMLQPMLDAKPPTTAPLTPEITRVLPDDLVPTASLTEVESAAVAWYTQWAEPTVARVKDGHPPTAAEVNSGRELFDRFRTAYDVYIADMRQGRVDALSHLSLLTSLLFTGVITSALLALIGGALLWYLMRRWVSKPVQRLAAEARVVSEGDLEHQVTAEGPVEFIQLGADVEAMRLRLVAQIAAVEAAGREVAAARGALEEQTLELQRSNRELEQFAYVASHDLQEPLRKVASFCQMLQRRYAGQLDDRADQYIHFAVDGAKRMQQLINDLLEFSRVGRLTTPQTDVDLMTCLKSALFNLETAIEESGAEVTSDQLPHVLGEGPLLTQLLQNLIGNAIKFHSDQPPLIRLGVRRDEDTWEFWCSDNGIGIEAEYADRVFLIFQRLHPKETYGGTGIGLAMCKKIVEHHGGRIWIDSSGENAGATVRFTLPVIKAVDSAESAAVLSDVAS
jgi:signal transduction histidine kinase